MEAQTSEQLHQMMFTRFELAAVRDVLASMLGIGRREVNVPFLWSLHTAFAEAVQQVDFDAAIAHEDPANPAIDRILAEIGALTSLMANLGDRVQRLESRMESLPAKRELPGSAETAQ